MVQKAFAPLILDQQPGRERKGGKRKYINLVMKSWDPVSRFPPSRKIDGLEIFYTFDLRSTVMKGSKMRKSKKIGYENLGARFPLSATCSLILDQCLGRLLHRTDSVKNGNMCR